MARPRLTGREPVFTGRHAGTGLHFGPTPPHARQEERDARAALERTCHECGSFNASRGYGQPGVGQQRAESQRWSCDEPGCRAAVEAWWRDAYHDTPVPVIADQAPPRPPQPDLFGSSEPPHHEPARAA